MALLTVQTSSRNANPITRTAASASGDKFPNTARELLFVEHINGAGSAVTLTITTQQTVDGLAVADRAVSIGPGTIHVLGPFDKTTYNDGDGNVVLAYSAHADIKVAAVRPA